MKFLQSNLLILTIVTISVPTLVQRLYEDPKLLLPVVCPWFWFENTPKGMKFFKNHMLYQHMQQE